MIRQTLDRLTRATAKVAPWVNLARKITVLAAAVFLAATTASAIHQARNEDLSFTLATGPASDSGYLVTCQALNERDPNKQATVAIGDYWLESSHGLGTMSDSQLLSYYEATYPEGRSKLFPDTEFMAQLRQDIGFYCGELRENQQTEVLLIAGKGILWAMALAVLAYITAPRGPRRPYPTVTGSP